MAEPESEDPPELPDEASPAEAESADPRIGLSGKHKATLAAICANPVRSNVKQRDVESLFRALGATITECKGSGIIVLLDGVVLSLHRPHPQPDMDKGAVKSVRRFLSGAGYSC